MQPNIAADLETWKATFRQELTAELETLRTDNDIYGFGIVAPEDHIMSAIGRESKLSGEQTGSSFWIDRRYSPVEWDYLPHAFGESCDQLAEISSKYQKVFISETCEHTPEGMEFREALYSACLDVMSECDSA